MYKTIWGTIVTLKRRDFLKVGSASIASAMMASMGLISWSPRSYSATLSQTFYITEGLIAQPDGVDVYFRGFSSSANALNTPGEALVVQQGDTLNITIINTLNSSHRFVIEELNVDSGNIPPGGEVNFSFQANEVGTCLYYDNSFYPYNRLLGLHGALAVMPYASTTELYKGSAEFSQQYFWLFHDIDPVWHNALQNNQTPSSVYTPQYFTLNGLSGRPPGASGSMDENIDSMADPASKLDGYLGKRTLIRCLNAGKAKHAVHTHGNHMEWLSSNGKVRPDVWLKDIVPLDANGGTVDVIFPFETPPDAWPPVTNDTLIAAENEGRHFAFPMHLHDEMTQTAGGGLYMFGALTDIYYHSK